MGLHTNSFHNISAILVYYFSFDASVTNILSHCILRNYGILAEIMVVMEI